MYHKVQKVPIPYPKKSTTCCHAPVGVLAPTVRRSHVPTCGLFSAIFFEISFPRQVMLKFWPYLDNFCRFSITFIFSSRSSPCFNHKVIGAVDTLFQTIVCRLSRSLYGLVSLLKHDLRSSTHQFRSLAWLLVNDQDGIVITWNDQDGITKLKQHLF